MQRQMLHEAADVPKHRRARTPSDLPTRCNRWPGAVPAAIRALGRAENTPEGPKRAISHPGTLWGRFDEDVALRQERPFVPHAALADADLWVERLLCLVLSLLIWHNGNAHRTFERALLALPEWDHVAETLWALVDGKSFLLKADLQAECALTEAEGILVCGER